MGMSKLEKVLKENKGKRCAIYGLGTETGRFLITYGNMLPVVGLLDSFRSEGEIFGYPIISMQKALEQGIALIIVVARPGSCKAIAKRIGALCRENGVLLFDVRGRNLLEEQKAAYEFKGIDGESMEQLMWKIDHAEMVSFDLFDTLVTRKVLNYTDVFDLLEKKLAGQGIYIASFATLRLSVEKELSRGGGAPNLTEIYEEVLRRAGGSFVSAWELAKMEWEIDRSLMLPRYAVCSIFKDTVKKGKRTVITTDSYYNEEQIRRILADFHLDGYAELFVSCEKGTAKTGRLFGRLLDMNNSSAKKILHIGDDETADIECAENYQMDTYRIYSGSSLFDLLGGLGVEREIASLSDRIKVGLFVAELFNNPFVFEDEERKLHVPDASAVGYLFCAPMITDFTLWLHEKAEQEDIHQILFCARDGFLIGRLFRKIDMQTKSFYLLASRTAVIRAGVENEEDLAYVDSMGYSGTRAEGLKARFGIENDRISVLNSDKEKINRVILNRALKLRENYKKYIARLGIGTEKTALFDFVAKGTAQLYLKRLFAQHIKGFYFLQLEPEFMNDKNLDIEPFYADEEKDGSAIFDLYYILETILTSPYPTVEEFDENGTPVYGKETRREQDIQCLKRVQEGIGRYFDDYMNILSEDERTQNKRIDEVFLSLIGRVVIEDKDFLSLTVEDPFFGRMTAVADVIG